MSSNSMNITIYVLWYNGLRGLEKSSLPSKKGTKKGRKDEEKKTTGIKANAMLISP